MLTYRLDAVIDAARRDDFTYILTNNPIGINTDTNMPEDVTPNAFMASFFPYATVFHGGVRVPSSTTENIGYQQRETLHAEGKARIARAVAARVPNDCSLIPPWRSRRPRAIQFPPAS